MCIIFFKFDPRPASKNAYRLILAANRDEFYIRPSKVADFWGSNTELLSGLDLESGREGGSWLGISKRGHLAAITNYMDARPNPDAQGRGFLVSNYLMDKDLNCYSYLKKVSAESHLYNGFNLLTAEFNASWFPLSSTVYMRVRGLTTVTTVNTDRRYCVHRIYGLSNSLLDTPWRKVLQGKSHFTSVVSDQSLSRDGLMQELLNVLCNEELNTPDPVLESQNNGYSKPQIEAQSAVFVRYATYGTRTNTIILIDAEGDVTFTERTMLDCDTSKWRTSCFQFKLQE
ncbi:Transport and Golgi organization 2 [Liparis tanakae]|uniref:Transport and Golgi organization 2 n=1 Tax=Liparis tanakae TaxID=230148 RepID=A0A4Z2IG29_9TELE|nr:Transport and Golgi organization 2 [Liparis tanakae]